VKKDISTTFVVDNYSHLIDHSTPLTCYIESTCLHAGNFITYIGAQTTSRAY